MGVGVDAGLAGLCAQWRWRSSGRLRGARGKSSFLQFTSPVSTPFPVNNTVSARWFPAKQHSHKAVVVLPHWNSKPQSYVALCRILAKLGISTLRLSLPYHDTRLPA